MKELEEQNIHKKATKPDDVGKVFQRLYETKREDQTVEPEEPAPAPKPTAEKQEHGKSSAATQSRLQADAQRWAAVRAAQREDETSPKSPPKPGVRGTSPMPSVGPSPLPGHRS